MDVKRNATSYTHTALATDSEVAYTGSEHELRIVICSTQMTNERCPRHVNVTQQLLYYDLHMTKH